jgi:hypothetical protein
MTHTPLPISFCPICFYKMDCASQYLGEERPEPGDPSLCLNCGAILVFNEEMRLRKIKPFDLRELMSDPEVWKAIELAQFQIQRRGRFKK